MILELDLKIYNSPALAGVINHPFLNLWVLLLILLFQPLSDTNYVQFGTFVLPLNPTFQKLVILNSLNGLNKIDSQLC